MQHQTSNNIILLHSIIFNSLNVGTKTAIDEFMDNSRNLNLFDYYSDKVGVSFVVQHPFVFMYSVSIQP